MKFGEPSSPLSQRRRATTFHLPGPILPVLGVKWRVKLGPEAQPETAATRLAWGVGYFTDEDYLVPYLRVLEMPAKLHRGQSLIAPGGYMLNARLERHVRTAGRSARPDGRTRDSPDRHAD